MLNTVRDGWREPVDELAGVASFSEEQRAKLVRILRRRLVQRAAAESTSLAIVANLMGIAVMVFVWLVVPAATMLVMWTSYAVHGWSAYLTFYVVYAFAFFYVAIPFMRDRPRARSLFGEAVWLGLLYGALLFGANVIGNPAGEDLTVAIVAAIGLAPVAALTFRAVFSLLGLTLYRASVSKTSTLVPAQALAAWLTDFLVVLSQQRKAWLRHRSLREVTDWTGDLIDVLERDPGHLLNSAGLSRTARTEIALRGRRAAHAIRAYECRLLSIVTAAELDALVKEVAAAALQVADGEWLAGPDETPPRKRRIASFVQRVIPSAVLAAVAFTLPLLPGVSVEPATMTSIQGALLLAAVLALLPVQAANVERALSAYKQASRPTE